MQTIIFLHGGPGFKDYLRPYFEELSSEFNCIFYDQLQGENIKIHDLIFQLDELVKNCEDKPILLGHSWGGVLATEYALNYQSSLSGLILISTGLDATQWLQYNDELKEQGLEGLTRDELFFTEEEKDAGKAMFAMDSWSGFSEETFDAIFANYLNDYNLLRSLDTLKLPILNIFGEYDLRFSKNVTTSFKNFNGNIVDFEIENSGHFPFLLQDNRNIILSQIKSLKREV